MPTATTSGQGSGRPTPIRFERRLVPPVPLLLDRERTLVMDFAAMDAFEQETGVSAWSVEAWSDPSPRIAAALIWAALLHDDPDLTPAEVRRMPGMEVANTAYLVDRLAELWGATMPDADTTGATDAAAESEASDGPNPRRRAG